MITRRGFLKELACAASVPALGPGRSAWAQNQPLRFGFADGVPPVSNTNAENGTVEGILPASIRMLSQSAEIDISMVAWPWQRTQQLFAVGSVDALCTTETENRRKLALFSREPLLLMGQVLVHRRDDPRFDKIASMEELLSFRHTNYRSNGWAKENLPVDDVTWVLSPQNAFKVIAAGRADVFINDEIFTRYQLNMLGLSESLSFSPTSALTDVGFKICIRKGFPNAAGLVAAYDRAILSNRPQLLSLKEDWVAGRYR